MRLRPRHLLILLAVLVVAAAAVAGYWHWAAGQLETAVAEWTAVQRERGYQIAYQGPAIEGFPTALAARFETPSVASPAQVTGGGWRWAGPTVSGAAKLWTPLTIDLLFPGRHEVARQVGNGEIPATLDSDQATGRITLGIDGRVQRAHLALVEVAWSDPVIGDISAARATGDLGPALSGGASRQDYLPIQLAVETLTLPEQLETPLGPRLQELTLDATLRGLPPRGPLREALIAWRDAGGVLDLHNGLLQWGPLILSGDGTLTLDQELRPLGAVSARIRGLGPTLDRFADAGLIKRGQAIAIELAASALAGERDANGEPVVKLPLTLQDGRLFLGPVPLFRLSPVL